MSEKKGFPVIDTASTYNTTNWPDQNWDESQGLYIEVYDNKVEILGRDFNRKEWITETHYTIDFSSASTLSFDEQYLFLGETNIIKLTFTNYGKKIMKNLDIGLIVPEGWSQGGFRNFYIKALKWGVI